MHSGRRSRSSTLSAWLGSTSAAHGSMRPRPQGATCSGHQLSVLTVATDRDTQCPSSFLLQFLSPVLQASREFSEIGDICTHFVSPGETTSATCQADSSPDILHSVTQFYALQTTYEYLKPLIYGPVCLFLCICNVSLYVCHGTEKTRINCEHKEKRLCLLYDSLLPQHDFLSEENVDCLEDLARFIILNNHGYWPRVHCPNSLS